MRTEQPKRSRFLDIGFDVVSLEAVIQQMRGVTGASKYSYVVTPNVDHIVRLHDGRTHDQDHRAVSAAYGAAKLCVCDSRIVARLAKIFGIMLPVVPGSDLTARIFAEVIVAGDVVMIVGGDDALIDVLRKRHPEVHFRHHVPPMGLRRNAAAMDVAVDHVVDAAARFTFLAVGSPQQELLAHRIALRPEAKGCALCIGASIAFIAGRETRAPKGMQKLGLEWSWRLAQDPARLWRRYLVEGPRIFLIAWRWRRNRLLHR